MSSSINRNKFLLFFLVLVCCCPKATAQGLTGQISGTINDPSGGVVPNAKVEVISQKTAQTRTVNSDSEGNFVVTQLLPGTYTLVITANGFKKFEQQGLISAEWGQTETGREAKFYELTKTGRAALKSETAQWERLSAAVGLVLRNA